jgi:Tfp pilus assembly protein PilF
VITVLEGEVEFYNEIDGITLKSGEQGEAVIGGRPRKTAVIDAKNVIQWALYYPAVLDPKELGLSPAEERAVAASLAAYRAGDLLGALEKYPKNYRPNSAAARLYYAGVVLAVGQVEEAAKMLAGVPRTAPGRQALEQMIAAVTQKDWSRAGTAGPRTASEWLGESYYHQSKADLDRALKAARKATELSPESGFAWTRVAELEFSFGRARDALKALDTGLKFTPRNAQAHALRGFLLSANNNIDSAREAFNEAIALDGALGNGWLGRGLTYLRQGKDEQGRQDLQIAATVEPTRSIVHAYLGKAFSQVGDNATARLDLKRAAELDLNDPTPWLYSAIQNKQENRYNEAARDLEKSLELSKNRRVYRSNFMLDQDRAVRSANLAAIYQNNGMPEVAVREATRAVNDDYGNASAHLFLANAFDARRDPTRVLLRYETPWFNELLIANLLSPVGGGPLSQYVSQQEYSKLFEANRLGFASQTDYYSYGELRETASQFGVFGNFSYAFDTEYLYNDGLRPNGQISRSESYATFKFQLGPQDTLFLQAKFQNLEHGDIFQRYDQREVDGDAAAKSFDFREVQDPGLLLLGWHREWNPGIHTVLLGGRLAAQQTLRASRTNQFLVGRDVTGQFPAGFQPPADFDPARPLASQDVSNVLRGLTGHGSIYGIGGEPFEFDRSAELEIYTGELNQIFTIGPQTLVLGGRYQSGTFTTRQRLDRSRFGRGEVDPGSLPREAYADPAADQDFAVDFDRASLYLYDFWRVTPKLTLIGGVSYDRMNYPDNFRSPPINDRENNLEQISPKAGFIYQPHPSTVIRGAYTKGVSGVSFDESVRLEPTQIAGFNQASRTFISESVAGSVAGAEFETWGISLEQKLPTSTYWGIEYNLIKQDVDRSVGAFDLLTNRESPDVFGSLPSTLNQTLEYREDVLSATINQLVGDRWSFGVRYRYSKATLSSSYGELNAAAAALESSGAGRGPGAASLRRVGNSKQSSLLHEVSIFALYNHPNGFFARAEANWYNQENDGYARDLANPRNDPRAGDDFWQLNAFVGYRFFRNQCEVSLGFLNITGTDYQLAPLNYYTELPRDRTLFARVKLSF